MVVERIFRLFCQRSNDWLMSPTCGFSDSKWISACFAWQFASQREISPSIIIFKWYIIKKLNIHGLYTMGGSTNNSLRDETMRQSHPNKNQTHMS
jgi:hypothetical protein